MMKVESNISFKLYVREEVELATNNFDDSAIIGEGGQGTVYIGHNLDPDNNPVAIKSLQFDVPVLVYEYVPNRTLHYLIHSHDNKDIRTLALDKRKKVISKKECLALVFQEALRKGKHHELLDSEIIVDDQDNMDVVHQIAHVAARCLVMPGDHRPTMREVAEELKLLEGVVKHRPGVLFNGDRLLMVPERSVANTSEFYSGGRTTDFDILKKKAPMSIEFAR
ncbi:hypothetical protein PR202_ga20637 [Eleusine coracana subsp. coracana]|uniref:Uncharacterized protein n=1 Tax=Eleusine coracana subsp. coracana TaxID=191504 RepID=A0AAV5CZA3_ELECO|nr:hypothetical protein PR202_ga20637 [Eleusine coracana subsp. coracana]